MNKKLNCWEFYNCGREPNGQSSKELGVCPAATERRLDGVHNGINAGRACWVIAGTYCHGETQGLFAQKYSTCKDCEFYQLVLNENFHNIRVSHVLLKEVRKGNAIPQNK
ncbi:MAG: hypothetical protein KKD63_00315 [Proteobacteria bacterium]|nr:hypothetical protein [Pseudomonadota bacterium]